MSTGERVRTRRMQLQLTITEVAKRSGLSVSYLSQLEHGYTQPSLDSLFKIAKGLDVSLSFFDGPANGHNKVRSPQDFHYFSLGNSGAIYARMGLGDADCQLEPLLITLPPGSSEDSLGHTGEAFVMVLQGRLWVCLEGQEHTVSEGNSLHVKSGMSYRWRNTGPKETKLLWVGTPKLM